MTALRWLYRSIDALAAMIVITVVVALLGLVVLQFLDRYVAHRWQGFPADEYVKVGLVWLCFVGFGLALRGGLEIRVDYLDQFLAPAARRWMYGFLDLVTLALFAVILFKGMRLYEVGSLQMILGTEMTVAIPVVGMMFGCTQVFLAVAARLAKRFFGMDI